MLASNTYRSTTLSLVGTTQLSHIAQTPSSQIFFAQLDTLKKKKMKKKKKCKVMPEVRGTYFKNTLLPCVKHQHNYFIKHHPLDRSLFAQLGTLKKKKKGHHILLLWRRWSKNKVYRALISRTSCSRVQSINIILFSSYSFDTLIGGDKKKKRWMFWKKKEFLL